MAKLYVTEFGGIVQDAGFPIEVAKTNVIVDQTPVATGGSSAQSAAFNAGTRIVRLHLDANGGVGASIAFGANPTALTNANARLSPNQTEYFAVNAGDKVACINDAV
jgi:hypothetical protein